MNDPARLPAGFRPGGRFAEWRPRRPEYVVADVDGTLLGASGEPSPRVVEAARRAVASGLPVGFATGRMRLGVQALHAQLGLPGPHVLHNGAEVVADGEVVAAWPLSDTELAAVLGVSRELDLYAELYVGDGFYVTARDERARIHWDILGREPDGVVRDPADLPGPVLKTTFAVFDPSRTDELVAALHTAGLQAGPAGSPITPDITYVNATDPAVDKGRAVGTAAAHLGVDLSAVLAVGDAHNDLSMLAVVGTAVAMGQAEDEIVAAAHLVAPTVDDDGVADVLDHVLAWRDG